MSAILTNEKVLVLNKNWTPVAAVTLQDAITKLCNTYKDGTPKAKIIEPESYQTFTWEDWGKLKLRADDRRIAAANMQFRIPEVILLSRYEKLPRPKAHFSRRTLYKRDKMICQYCGCKPAADEWSVDHVKPRAQGGQSTWENCVVACVKCNRKKADRTPEQAGMKLLTKPKKPDVSVMKFETFKPVKSWQAFLGEMYWNVSIEEAVPDA